MRLVSWNIAWFDRLFDAKGRLRADTGEGGFGDVPAVDRLAAIGAVLRGLDADGVMVIEAPDTRTDPHPGSLRDAPQMLRRFARAHGLRARHAVAGFASHTKQEIAFIFDRRALRAAHDPHGSPRPAARAPRFDGAFLPRPQDLPPGLGDARDLRFSKPPLELAVTCASGARLRVIGCHIKSKAPHGARTPAGVARRQALNARRQIGQSLWLRARIDAHLARGEDLIVMGDLNDGPGLDAQEQKLGASAVEIVMGEGGDPARRLLDPHARAVLDRRGPAPYSARFHRPDLTARAGGVFTPLLDYILISPGLSRAAPRWQIVTPETAGDLAPALHIASDHYPVVLDIDL